MEPKTLRPAEDIVEDILKLKMELWEKYKFTPVDSDGKWIDLKINSCLYSGYPERKVPKNGRN